jgi:hypothetical protein
MGLTVHWRLPKAADVSRIDCAEFKPLARLGSPLDRICWRASAPTEVAQASVGTPQGILLLARAVPLLSHRPR